MRAGSKTHFCMLLAMAVAFPQAAGCGHGETEWQAKLTEISDLQAQLRDSEDARRTLEAHLAELEGQNAQMIARLQALGQDVEGLRAERTTLTDSLAETQRALEELRAREAAQQARLSTFRAMLERFRAMIDSGRLRVRIVRNRMVVELPDNVLFDSGQAELKPEGQVTLTEVGQILATITDRVFQVAGHTDSVPSRRWASNWELSTARAVSVARFLIGLGMPADHLSAAGYSDTQPIDTNDTDEGRAHNRRIEIVLVPNLDELPDLSSLVGESTGS